MVNDVPGPSQDDAHTPGVDTKLERYQCLYPEGIKWQWKHTCWVQRLDSDEPDGKKKCAGLLGLPLSCRRIYKETIPILYGTNTFDFKRFETIHGLFQCVPHQHLDRIRHVRLFVTLMEPPNSVKYTQREDYEEVWKKLGTIKDLKELKVCMAIHMAIGHIMRNRRAYLEPLKVIKGLNCFECYLPPDTSQLPTEVKEFVPGCRVAGWDVWKR
ncbi:Hypothetical protein D9617_18g033870 [Elsinoe fawcettii]|nr:Hypothetical protein D9617_18g033870 [Elsinoe fawcettii]